MLTITERQTELGSYVESLLACDSNDDSRYGWHEHLQRCYL